MHRFNLNNVSKHNLEIVENYLISEKISNSFLEHFAEISFYKQFYENTNNLHLLEIIEISIIHYDILLKNKKTVIKILSIEESLNILEILIISIEEENTKRFKNKLETILKKSDKRLIKDKDLFDKKTKI